MNVQTISIPNKKCDKPSSGLACVTGASCSRRIFNYLGCKKRG